MLTVAEDGEYLKLPEPCWINSWLTVSIPRELNIITRYNLP